MPTINSIIDDLEEEIRNLRAKVKLMGEQNERLEKVNKDLKSKLDTDLAICRIKQLEDANNVLEKEINDLKQQNNELGKKCQDETRIRKNWKQMCHEQNERIWDLMKKKQELHQQLDTECKKKQDLDDMRDYLHKFCENRWCDGCPLSTDEFKCGRGYRFRKWCFPDNGAIPDEDLKRYYEKVRDWEKKEEKSSEEVPCSFNWKLDDTEYTIETSIPRADYDNIVKIISGKE